MPDHAVNPQLSIRRGARRRAKVMLSAALLATTALISGCASGQAENVTPFPTSVAVATTVTVRGVLATDGTCPTLAEFGLVRYSQPAPAVGPISSADITQVTVCAFTAKAGADHLIARPLTTNEIPGLLKALSATDISPVPGQGCLAYGSLAIPIIATTGIGQHYYVDVPVDGCGHYQQARLPRSGR
jgi:hypothetical protein